MYFRGTIGLESLGSVTDHSCRNDHHKNSSFKKLNNSNHDDTCYIAKLVVLDSRVLVETTRQKLFTVCPYRYYIRTAQMELQGYVGVAVGCVKMWLIVSIVTPPPPPPCLPAPNASSSECAAYSSVLVVVDVVEVNVIMGAGMGSLVVHAVEMNVIMGAGMHSLVSCFAVNSSNLAVVEVFIRIL